MGDDEHTKEKGGAYQGFCDPIIAVCHIRDHLPDKSRVEAGHLVLPATKRSHPIVRALVFSHQ